MSNLGAAACVMARLRDETTEHHQRAESRPFERALLGGTLPRALYVELLAQRYLVHRVLERAARDLRDAHPVLVDILRDELFQEANLVADLEHFGIDQDAIVATRATRALIEEIERLADQRPLALLGVYYVFEGSKNGARYVARSVANAYGLPPGSGLRYLDPHGEQQRALWLDFKQRMDDCAFSTADQDAMVAAARLTFDCVGELDDELWAKVPAACTSPPTA